MLTQAEKGQAFRALHEHDRAFIIPNPWDVGTARLLAHLGFEALATTSAGYAFSVGRRDNTIERSEMMAHVSAIASATDLPVSADLENGYGDTPEIVAETIRLAAEAGLVGGSIEDVSRRAGRVVYEVGHAVNRVRAAAEVIRNFPFRFTLTARAENYLVGRLDLNDTITRLQGYQEAGADVLYAPGLAKQGGYRSRGQLRGSTGERRHGTARRPTELGRAVGNGRQSRQRRERTFSRRPWRLSWRCKGDARAWHLMLSQGRR
jgi:2-methylisocitrate lyase-like PEP mutase family enzyme